MMMTKTKARLPRCGKGVDDASFPSSTNSVAADDADADANLVPTLVEKDLSSQGGIAKQNSAFFYLLSETTRSYPPL
ncbi:hypothetical protein QYF36_021667 [Acer negundo]|nr:hypothetical protein QYF36_021667 [Acer negundo]